MNEEALGRCFQRLGTVFKELGQVFLGFSENLSHQQHPSSQASREQPLTTNVQPKSTETPERIATTKQQQQQQPASLQASREQSLTPNIQPKSTETPGKNTITKPNKTAPAQAPPQQQTNVRADVSQETIGTSFQHSKATTSPTKVVNKANPAEHEREHSSNIAQSVDKTTELRMSSPASEGYTTPMKDARDKDTHSSSKKKSDKKNKKKKDKHLDSDGKHSESKEKRKKDSKKKKHKHSSEKKKRKYSSGDRMSESEPSEDSDINEKSQPSHFATQSNTFSTQNNISSVQRQEQTNSSTEQASTLQQNGQENSQRNKRPRQYWNKEDDELFLESINKAISTNPGLTEKEVMMQLEQDFAGKRKREQLRKHYQSFQKSGKLPDGAPKKSD